MGKWVGDIKLMGQKILLLKAYGQGILCKRRWSVNKYEKHPHP